MVNSFFAAILKFCVVSSCICLCGCTRVPRFSYDDMNCTLSDDENDITSYADLSSYTFSEKGDFVNPHKMSTLYVDDTFFIYDVDVRYTKMLFKVSVDGECTGKDLRIVFVYDDEMHTTCTSYLDLLQGNTNYQLTVPLPAGEFSKVAVTDITVQSYNFSISDFYEFGD